MINVILLSLTMIFLGGYNDYKNVKVRDSCRDRFSYFILLSSNGSNSLMRMFSGNPERTITVAIKDGTAKQLKNSWDKKALSACGSAYTVVNLGSTVSTAGGHNSLSGTVSCN